MSKQAYYNCKHAGDLFRITKFDSDANVESSYLTDGQTCDCPAGVRPKCRHRTMLPLFKASRATDGQAFYDFDRGLWLAADGAAEESAEAMPPLPKGVVMVGLDDPALLHNTIAEAVGEPTIPEGNQPDRSALRRI